MEVFLTAIIKKVQLAIKLQHPLSPIQRALERAGEQEREMLNTNIELNTELMLEAIKVIGSNQPSHEL